MPTPIILFFFPSDSDDACSRYSPLWSLGAPAQVAESPISLVLSGPSLPPAPLFGSTSTCVFSEGREGNQSRTTFFLKKEKRVGGTGETRGIEGLTFCGAENGTEGLAPPQEAHPEDTGPAADPG